MISPVTLALSAMGTRFELVLYGEDPVRLRAAGQEALQEIERLDRQLSFYLPESDLSDLNRRAGYGRVRLDPRVFALLERARRLSEETAGAFDITVAPLMQCWGFVGGTGKLPNADEIAQARERVGMRLISLDAEDSSVRFSAPGVLLDLGAIGKGYAIECAMELLQNNGIACALLHGGTSTVSALGRPPGARAWNVAIHRPFAAEGSRPLATVELRNESLSVSAPHGKWFLAQGKRYGHVIDPRSGYPVGHSLLAAVILPSATDSDALSTALLAAGPSGLNTLVRQRPNLRALLAEEGPGGDREGEVALQVTGYGVPWIEPTREPQREETD